MFAHQLIRALPMGSNQFAVLQLVSAEALVASGVRVLDDGKGKAGEAAHVYLICGSTDGGTDGIIAGDLHVQQADVPRIPAFVDGHLQHLIYGLILLFDAAVVVQVMITGHVFTHPCRKLVTQPLRTREGRPRTRGLL